MPPTHPLRGCAGTPLGGTRPHPRQSPVLARGSGSSAGRVCENPTRGGVVPKPFRAGQATR